MTSEISFYVDCLIVEALANDESLKKQAAGGMVMALIEKVKEYVGNNIRPNDKVGSIIDILAPGALIMAFKAMGLGWLGFLFGLAMRVFHIDVVGILSSIWSSIKGMIGGGKQVSSSQVDSVVQGAVQDHYKPASQEEAEAIAKSLETKSFSETMQDARFVKLAMIQYQQGKMSRTAGLLDSINRRGAKTSNILSRVLGWVFKIALASAGLMVAGDVVNKLLGRPNALDGSIQNGKPVDQPSAAPVMPTTRQTKFKVKPSYSMEHNNSGDSAWAENVANNPQSIGEMIISFAKDVYDGLDGKESIIRGTAGFQALQDKIAWYNRTAEGGPVTYIPKMFSSKKQMTDYFIDDVAEKST